MLAKFANVDNIDIIENVDNVAIVDIIDNVEYDDNSFWQIWQFEAISGNRKQNFKNICHLITNMVLRDACATKNSLRQYFFP